MSSPSKKVCFRDYVFHVYENVYEPAEDSFLFAENLAVEKGEVVLDMGTGCGILA
jgi:release factor glutamine methyltransferase